MESIKKSFDKLASDIYRSKRFGGGMHIPLRWDKADSKSLIQESLSNFYRKFTNKNEILQKMVDDLETGKTSFLSYVGNLVFHKLIDRDSEVKVKSRIFTKIITNKYNDIKYESINKGDEVEKPITPFSYGDFNSLILEALNEAYNTK